MRYRSLVADSARWDGFAFRTGDIVISTPTKCGTTWTPQMLCARDAAEYAARVASLVPTELAVWAHLGRVASGIEPHT